jgi:hypothetical protein
MEREDEELLTSKPTLCQETIGQVIEILFSVNNSPGRQNLSI